MAKRIENWYSNYNLVTSYIKQHNKYPSTLAQDVATKTLASWWSRQKHLVRQHNCTLDQRQIAAVNAVTEQNAHLERDGVWEQRYQTLTKQYATHASLFSHTSSNSEEVRIMRWWNQQKAFARKFLETGNASSGMNQARFDKVQTLLRAMNSELVATAETVANN